MKLSFLAFTTTVASTFLISTVEGVLHQQQQKSFLRNDKFKKNQDKEEDITFSLLHRQSSSSSLSSLAYSDHGHRFLEHGNWINSGTPVRDLCTYYPSPGVFNPIPANVTNGQPDVAYKISNAAGITFTFDLCNVANAGTAISVWDGFDGTESVSGISILDCGDDAKLSWLVPGNGSYYVKFSSNGSDNYVTIVVWSTNAEWLGCRPSQTVSRGPSMIFNPPAAVDTCGPYAVTECCDSTTGAVGPACCGNKPYDPFRSTCCDDGSTIRLGVNVACTPSPQPSSVPSAAPSSSPSTSPSSNPSTSPTASASPTSVPSSNPSSVPSAKPSSMPSAKPSSMSSAEPSSMPSAKPTRMSSTNPSSVPSVKPSSMPSVELSAIPSAKPSSMPSTEPSSIPSTKPSSMPSSMPSTKPTRMSSANPSSVPSVKPSSMPSVEFSAIPSAKPSSMPSAGPSSIPSTKPSSMPSAKPTRMSSTNPSSVPSVKPSSMPSANPSLTPSAGPTPVTSTNPTTFPSTEQDTSLTCEMTNPCDYELVEDGMGGVEVVETFFPVCVLQQRSSKKKPGIVSYYYEQKCYASSTVYGLGEGDADPEDDDGGIIANCGCCPSADELILPFVNVPDTDAAAKKKRKKKAKKGHDAPVCYGALDCLAEGAEALSRVSRSGKIKFQMCIDGKEKFKKNFYKPSSKDEIAYCGPCSSSSSDSADDILIRRNLSPFTDDVDHHSSSSINTTTAITEEDNDVASLIVYHHEEGLDKDTTSDSSDDGGSLRANKVKTDHRKLTSWLTAYTVEDLCDYYPEFADLPIIAYGFPSVIYRIQGAVGVTYNFETCGRTDSNTDIQILDEAGSTLASDENGCGDRQSTLTWTSPDDGTYYVRFGNYLEISSRSTPAWAGWSIISGTWSGCTPPTTSQCGLSMLIGKESARGLCDPYGLECCDSTNNIVGPACCGTNPYSPSVSTCCNDGMGSTTIVAGVNATCPSITV